MYLTILYYSLILIVLFFVITFSVAVYIKLKYEFDKGVCKSNARLDNKIVLVTGGNQGIGLEIVRDLASRGASVIIACRDEKRASKAIEEITKETGNKNVTYRHLDLSKFSNIRKFVENFNQSYDRLDILINNAGVGSLGDTISEDGIDMLMQVNHLGPFLLTNLLLDKLKASEAGRIIITSSFLHLFAWLNPKYVNGLDPWSRFWKYGNSKLCNVMWGKALAKRLPSNVTVNSLHPGNVKTDIFNWIHPVILKYLLFLMDVLNFKTAKEGAQTTIHLAVSEDVAGVSGKYFMECKEAKPSSAVDNDELVEKVWSESLRLTKYKF